jgi:cell division protein ZapA (FtsZ GTPase activity inhibitor)
MAEFPILIITIKDYTMTTITIDEQEYELDNLSDDAKAQLASIQFVDAEIARLQSQSAVLQTARVAYAAALKTSLPATLEGDTIKFT